MQSVTLRAFAAAVLALLAVTSMANAQQEEGVYTIPH
jgi:ABC-type sugar transport system substrate-binding protein